MSKRFGAEPLLEEKSYEYLEDMLQTAFLLAASGWMPAPKHKDRSGVMAPLQRPNRNDIRDLKQTLEAARWTSTGSKISRSRANYHNHVEFCPRPPTVAAMRKVGFTASRDGHFIFQFVARKIHGNSSI